MLNRIKVLAQTLFRKSNMERELEEEIRDHLERQTLQNERLGMAQSEARRAARSAFGGVEQAKERSRDVRGFRWLEELMQDLRFGARMLRKSPGFTSIALLTLCIGVGGGAAIFSIVKAVLITPLPFVEPDRLLLARYRTKPNLPEGDFLGWIDRRDLSSWRANNRAFDSVSGFVNHALILPGESSPEFIRGFGVTPELFLTLGVKPALGRFFQPEDDLRDDRRLIVLSDELWRRRFGADPEIIGQRIRTRDEVFVVVGVAAPGFNFPLQQRLDIVRTISTGPGFWTLLNGDLSRNGNIQSYNTLFRLKKGVSFKQAQAEIDALFSRRPKESIKTDYSIPDGVRLIQLKDQTVGRAEPALWMLFGAIGLIVLMVSSNIAGLLLIRADQRRKETAIRQALGAGRLRLVRQALIESLLLSSLGGIAGVLLAYGSLASLLKLSPHNIPRLSESRIDGWTLLFTLGVTLLAGLFFGAIPAWRSAHNDLNATIKQTAGIAVGWRRSRLAPANALATVQVALAATLTLGAGLLLNSFTRLMRVDPGLRTDGLTAAIVPMSGDLFERVIQRLEATPGVEAAGASNGLPLTEHGNAAYLAIEGRPRLSDSDPSMYAMTHIVSAGYQRTLEIPLLRGRFLTTQDITASTPVAVINEAAAQRFWHGEDPLGKRLSLGKKDGHEIFRQVVGIVKSTHHFGLEQEPRPEVYVPFQQEPWPMSVLFIRSRLAQAELQRVIRQAVAEADRTQPIVSILSMNRLLADSVANRRFSLALLTGFSLTAILIAAMGVYGVISQSVVQRTAEIGVRMALGAKRGDILRLIANQALKLLALGLCLGLGVSLGLARTVSSLLYGIGPNDPITYFFVVIAIAFAAALAAFFPARRAIRIDPTTAFRSE